MGYTNSSLVSYTKISPNKTANRKHSIDRITPHCVVGQLSVEELGSVFEPVSKGASCNYAIGHDGRVALIVEEKDRSWCSSSESNDHNYKVDKKKDIIAVLEIKEYVFTIEPQAAEQGYKWESINIDYKGGILSVTAANVEGHWLVPVRQILNMLGYNVIWNAAEKAIYMTREGFSYKLHTQFEIYDGVSYAYIYQVCKELGFKAEWNGNSRTVVITDEWKWDYITLKFGGNEYEIRAAMVNYRFIVPVRHLLEFLGYEVEWNAEEKAIYFKALNDSIWYKLFTQYWIYDNISYCYLYRVCEETGFTAQWDRDNKTVTFEKG